MPQGLSKKSAKKPTGVTKPITKKHLAVQPSKNARLAALAKRNKKFTSGLTAQTERMLGERAGHLEMIGTGRKKTSGAGAGSGSGKGSAGKGKSTKKS